MSWRASSTCSPSNRGSGLPGHWQGWQSRTGATVARGGPGSMMYVPRGCPHAFANPGPGPARMVFLVSPSGHEHYQRELAELVASAAGPLDATIAELRARHDIEQHTPQVMPGRPTRPHLAAAAMFAGGAKPGRSSWPGDQRRYGTCWRVLTNQVREPPICAALGAFASCGRGMQKRLICVLVDRPADAADPADGRWEGSPPGSGEPGQSGRGVPG